MEHNKKRQLADRHILKLKKDLRQKGFKLELTEEKIQELEIFYSKLLVEQKISFSYFEEYFFNILIFLGEIHIQKHGGEWKFKVDEKGEVFPIAIKCLNGNLATDYEPVLRNLLIFDIKVTASVELWPSYSTIERNCQSPIDPQSLPPYFFQD